MIEFDIYLYYFFFSNINKDRYVIEINIYDV